MLRKLAVAAVAAAIGLTAVTAPAHAGAKKTVTVRNNSFSPGAVKIKKGDTVVWKWTQGGVPHNVTPSGGGRGSQTSSRQGFAFARTFAKKGTYKFECTIHPTQMRITVKVN
jgi:plastocyanin